jgi:hypothetical protein
MEPERRDFAQGNTVNLIEAIVVANHTFWCVSSDLLAVSGVREASLEASIKLDSTQACVGMRTFLVSAMLIAKII